MSINIGNIMATFNASIHYFVDKFGVLHRASDTITRNEQGKEYGTKRYVESYEHGKLLVVSMGHWFESQKSYRPFIEAHERARTTALELSQRAWTAPAYGAECSEEEWRMILNFIPDNGRPLEVGTNTERVIKLVMVNGYSITRAIQARKLDAAGSRRWVQRKLKEVRGWLTIIRESPGRARAVYVLK